MLRDMTMLIRFPETELANFRVFTVLHGGEIVKESDSLVNDLVNDKWIPVTEKLPDYNKQMKSLRV